MASVVKQWGDEFTSVLDFISSLSVYVSFVTLNIVNVSLIFLNKGIYHLHKSAEYQAVLTFILCNQHFLPPFTQLYMDHGLSTPVPGCP